MFAGFRVDPVELRTDILPSCPYQDFALQINDRHGNASKLIEVIHKRLDRRGINDVGQIEVSDVAFRGKDAFQF